MITLDKAVLQFLFSINSFFSYNRKFALDNSSIFESGLRLKIESKFPIVLTDSTINCNSAFPSSCVVIESQTFSSQRLQYSNKRIFS